MNIIIGGKVIEAAYDHILRDNILFQSKKIIVESDKSVIKIDLTLGRKLYIEGDIYSINQRNGEVILIDFSFDGLKKIARLFENEKLDKIATRLEGDFIGVIVEKNGPLKIFSDEFNRTEIFYSHEKDGMIFSTDLELISQLKADVAYSQSSLVNMLSIYGYYAPKQHTIYQDINRLGVGESFLFDGMNFKIEQREFIPLSAREYGIRENDRYEKNFREAIQKRSSDTCNWIYLSSGWDSTSILAMLNDIHGPSKIKAVIGEMKFSKRSGTINQFEIDRAKKVADYYNISLEIIPFDLCEQDSIDYWKQLSGVLKKQHIYSFSAYNFSRLYDYVQSTAGEDDAVFAGEISDGVHNFGFSQFATILEHPDLSFREYSDKMASYLFGPTFLKSIMENTYSEDAVYKLLRGRLGNVNFDDGETMPENEKLYKVLTSFFLRNSRVPFYGQNNSNLINEKGSALLENEIGEKYLRNASQNLTPDNIYAWLIYLYNSFYWQGGTARAFSARNHADGNRLKLPFWDGKIQNFLSVMPENWGRGLELRPTKYPLKWMLENKIDYPIHYQTGPHSYLYDVNPNFSHAGELLFGSHLSNYIKEILSTHPYGKVLSDEYFNLKYLRKIVDSYLDGAELLGTERNDLMSVATLCVIGWY